MTKLIAKGRIMEVSHSIPIKPRRRRGSSMRLWFSLALTCLVDAERSTRGLVLENKLNVLLVSDPRAGQSSASLVVSSGSQDDPDGKSGLADLLRRLVPKRSEDYPEESVLWEYLAANDGGSSSETHYNHTSYQFHVNTDALEGALGMFAASFVNPDFSTDLVAREATALKLPQLDSTDPVWEHFAAFYSANLMQLAVVAPYSLDYLEQLVVPRFAAVANSDRRASAKSLPIRSQAMVDDPQLNPLRTRTGLALQFLLPPAEFLPPPCAFDFIAYHLTRTGRASFADTEIERGHVEAIHSGAFKQFTGFSLFQLILSPIAEKHTAAILLDLFAYLDLLRSEGITQDRYDEYLNHNPQQDSPLGLAMRLAQAMHEGALASDAANHLQADAFDSAAIKHAVTLLFQSSVLRTPLAQLTSEAMIPGKDMYFPAMHQVLIQHRADLNSKQGVGLPPIKPTPKRTTRKGPKAITQVRNTPASRMWHVGCPDSPRAAVSLLVTGVQVQLTSAELVKMSLLALLVTERTREMASGDERLVISPVENKLKIQIQSDDVAGLLNKILAMLARLEVDPAAYSRVADEMLRDLDDFDFRPPHVQAAHQAYSSLQWKEPFDDSFRRHLRIRDHLAFQNWLKGFLACSRTTVLMVGNQDAKKVAKALEDFERTQGCAEQPPVPSSIPISGEAVFQSHNYDDEEANSAVNVYLDLYSNDQADAVALSTLTFFLLRADFFLRLKAQERVASYARTTMARRAGGGGIFFMAQSSKHPVDVEWAIENFLVWLVARVREMPEAHLQEKIRGLLAAREARTSSLDGTLGKYWAPFLAGTLDFEADDKVTAALAQVTAAQLVEFLEARLLKTPGLRRKFSVHKVAAGQDLLSPEADFLECGTVLASINHWKNNANPNYQ